MGNARISSLENITTKETKIKRKYKKETKEEDKRARGG